MSEERTTKTEVKPRPEVQWFSMQMEAKLRENDYKPHWQGEDMEWLIQRLREEVVELERAIYQEPTKNIVREAADVANFAMMIADNAVSTARAGNAGCERGEWTQ